MSDAAAIKLFRSFFGRAPREHEIVDIVQQKAVALRIGELDSVGYRIDGERIPNIHFFSSTDRPLLYVSSDGRQLYSVRGRYRFTDRGFVG
jgi:hypothetical protein